MNNYLNHIIDLSNIDKDIESFTPQLEKINAKLKDEESKIDKLKNEIVAIDESIKEFQKQKVQNDLHIGEFGEKIKQCKEKTALIKTEKEAQALKLEEEIAREQLQAANEEIERLEKIIANKNDEKKQKTSALDEALKNIEEIQKDTKAQNDEINHKIDEIYSKKQELTSKMDKKVLSFYEKIKKWAKNTAVVPVKKQACFGCFIKIDDTTYGKILQNEEIVTCPHCGRIVFYDKNL